MASLLTTISLDSGLFMRFIQWVGVPALKRFAMICKGTAELTRKYMEQIINTTTPDYVREIYLIRWRIGCRAKLTGHEYKAIQRELAKLLANYTVVFSCITYYQRGSIGSGFWVYWQWIGHDSNTKAVCRRINILSPSFVTGRSSYGLELAFIPMLPCDDVGHINDQQGFEYVICGDCNCRICMHG